MKVCIVGGGHIGTTLACYIKHHDPEKHVALYTRHPERFKTEIKCNDIEGKFSYNTAIDIISNEPGIAAEKADIVYIALPHFAVEKAFEDISPYVGKNAYIGVLPGGGGCEFFFKNYFDDSKTLFGFQRVPFTAKLERYGEETNLKSWKPFSVVATLQKDRIHAACERIEACGLKTKKATNYLEVALTPTNPILHTSRTHEIFGGYDRDYEFARKQKFYVGWTDEASKTLLEMDRELHKLLDAIIEIDTSAIRPLSEHYESPSIEALTAKINSIPTFQSVFAPMKESPSGNGTFVADVSSRMFTEDFPWGLAVIRSYCDYFEVDAPMMDKILSWYADYMGIEWYVDGRFCGKDLENTGIPRRYGIETKEQLLRCYIQ